MIVPGKALLRTGLRAYWPVWLLMGLTCLPEIVLMLADAHLVGTPRWRPLAYQYGAFWAGLLRDWRPNYAAQPVTMFFTYMFLHAGLGHLAGNMIVLGWLGRTLQTSIGTLRFMAIYVLSGLGAAAVFGIMTTSASPMVGASGALFGLAGAWVIGDWRQESRPIAEGGVGPRAAFVWLIQMTAFLILLNVATWVLQNGQLAWQAHLGGGVTGVVLAFLLRVGLPRIGR